MTVSGPSTLAPDSGVRDNRRVKAWVSEHFKLTLGIAAAAVFALLIVGQAFAGDEGDDDGAMDACEEFVEGQLRAPTTADFYDASATDLGGERWHVDGLVDSENGFGGTVQNRYACTVSYEGDGSWQLNRLTGLLN